MAKIESDENLLIDKRNIIPPSSERMLVKSESSDIEDKKEIINDKQEDDNKFLIEEDYLTKDECTALLLGTEPIMQKCYICIICNPKQNNFLCKFCYNKCHQKCRDFVKINQKQEDFKGEKYFSCYCGIKLKHKTIKPQTRELKICDLTILDQTLNAGTFKCLTHNMQICCVCSVECHKKCQLEISKDRTGSGEKLERQCLCRNENHTTYNEIALTFPLDEYQRLSNVSVWPIQILNILFNFRKFEKLSKLFKAMFNKKEISKEKKKKFFPLLELFSNTFNRKFKTLYYEDGIINIFQYDSLINYIKNFEVTNPDMILVKFRLIFILLFVHLKNDFQTTKSLTSIDFLCHNILERILYKKVFLKESIYNNKLNEKYNLSNLFLRNHELKDLVLKDICNFMTIAIDSINIEEYCEEFEIGLKFICFIIKKMIPTKEDLILLIDSFYVFFEKLFVYIDNHKKILFLLLDFFSGIFELFLMISVFYNDIVIANYLDENRKISSINSLELEDEFIHVNSPYGNKLFEMIMKLSQFLKKHYDLLNSNDNILNKYKEKMLKTQIKLEKLIKAKNMRTEVKIPDNGGLFSDKCVREYAESFGVFSLADNLYYKQIESITSDDLENYYQFCDKLENNYFNENPLSIQINEIIYDLKLKIENQLKVLFISSYSSKRETASKELYNLLMEFSSKLNDTINQYDNKINSNEKHQSKNELIYIKLKDVDNEEDIQNNSRLNKYLAKIAEQNEKLFPFLATESFTQYCEDFVDNFIISNLDETITKILVFFSHRRYPNLLSSELLEIVFSTLNLFFFSKRGMKYLLLGKNLVRLNKIFNRYNFKENNKNIHPNEEFGRTLDKNMIKINKTLEFCSSFFKLKKLYGLRIKNHKALHRYKKNMLEHICLFNLDSKGKHEIDFLRQYKKTINIFYYLSDDFEFEDLNQIKKQCVFIFKQNPIDIFKKTSLEYTFNNFKEKLQKNQNEQLHLRNNIIENKPLESKSRLLISLYFAFFRLFPIKTYYIYNNKETKSIMDILYDFNNLDFIKEAFKNDTFSLKKKIILLKYLRTLYFMDKLNEYSILNQTHHLTTMEFNLLVKSNALLDNKFEKSLNPQENLALPTDVINDLLQKYKLINDIEKVIQIYLHEIQIFPKQLYNNSINFCKKYYRKLLLDLKFICDYFYCKNNVWSKFQLSFYQLCIEFIPKIDIFRTVYNYLKTNNDTFNIDEDLLNELIDDENEDYNVEDADILNEDDQWNNTKAEAIATLKKLKSISFDIYDINEIYKIFNGYLKMILKISKLNGAFSLKKYLKYFDSNSEANFTPFVLLENLDYEYFYEEENDYKNEESNNKSKHFEKISFIKKNYFESFIDINNTNFLNIITKVENEGTMFDFRKKYIDFFVAFINSNQSNSYHLLYILLCIMTKMLFYYSEGIQDKFEEYINDEDFFPNLNRLLNMYIVLNLSNVKNIYAIKHFGKVNILSKLIIQFLQTLGEGFNTKYHNNIFKFQDEVPLIEDEEKEDENDTEKEGDILSDADDKSNKSNKIIEKDEEIKENKENIPSKAKYTQASLNIDIPQFKVTNTIYESLILNFKYIIYTLNMKNLIEGDLPYDKLITSITNIVDFLIEYIESEGLNNDIIKFNFKNLLFGLKLKKEKKDKSNLDILNEFPCINVLFYKIEEQGKDAQNYKLRKKIICYAKYKLSNLLNYLLLSKGKESIVSKLVKSNCTAIDLFSEIIYNYKELLNNLKIKNQEIVEKLEKIKKNGEISDYVNELINIYGYEEDFRNMIEFPTIIQYFTLIKIYEEFYNHKELKSHFENIKDTFTKSNDFDDYNIRSKLSYCLYLFLEQIILKVEIKFDNDDEEKNLSEIEVNKSKIVKLVMGNIKNDPLIKKVKSESKQIKKDKTRETLEDIEETESEEDQSDSEDNTNIKKAFFLRPYLTFALTEATKETFVKTVDRSNASIKYVSLVNFSDYSLFEMVVNRHLIGNSKVKIFFSNINFSMIEVINYLIIVINNIFIIYHFYKSPTLPVENYDIFDESSKSKLYVDNILISVIQAALLILILIIWYFFDFLNFFQYSIMKYYNQNFVFSKSGQDNKIPQTIIDYFQDKENMNSLKFFNEVIDKVSTWQRFYVGFFEVSIFNREINIFLFTIVLNILFLTIRNYLFLVVEILFIINIIPTLINILKAMIIKYLHILLVLIFDFLIIYIFMWIGFFFFQDFFNYEEILESSSGSLISESYCYSSLQCFLVYISLGTRNGGGITQAIEKISYQKDPRKFFGRFFHDIIFFLLVNLILGNVFLGIIIDTFGELRDKQTENENDRKNICFICQISNDACMKRNIDFDKHVNDVHNIWNYVYFLAYLHLNNPNNFNRVENSVWEKLKVQDYSWLPFEQDSDD